MVGSVFQDSKSQFFSAELAGEVAFPCENYGLSAREIRERTDAAIEAFKLSRGVYSATILQAEKSSGRPLRPYMP